MSEISFIATLDNSDVKAKAEEMQSVLARESEKMADSGKDVENSFDNVKKMLDALAANVKRQFGNDINKRVFSLSGQFKALGAQIRDTYPDDIQNVIKSVAEEMQKQADNTKEAMANFKGTDEELKSLETQYEELSNSAAHYSEIVEGINSNLSSDQILENSRISYEEPPQRPTTNQQPKQEQEVDYAYAQGFESVNEIIESGKGGRKEVEDWLAKLEELTKAAQTEAIDAAYAYESLKRSMPDGESSAQLDKLREKMESARENALSMSDELRGAQAAARNIGSSKTTSGLSAMVEKFTGGTKATQAFQSALKFLPAPIQGAVSAIGGLTKASLAFIATPLGIVLMALVGIFKAVQYAMTTTTSGLDDLTEKEKQTAEFTGTFSGIWTNLKNVFGAIGDTFVSLFSGDFEGAFNNWISSWKQSIFGWGEAISKEREAAVREVQLKKDRLKWSQDELDINKEIADAREEMYATTDQTKRMAAIDKAINATNKKYEEQIKLAQEELAIEMLHHEAGRDGKEDIAKQIELTNKLKQLEISQKQESLRFVRQKTAAQKALNQELINTNYWEKETSNKEAKDFNSLSDNTHQKALKDIELDREAQLLALQKQRDLALEQLDESNEEKRNEVREHYERESQHIIEFSNAKKIKENRDYWKRIQKENRDNTLSISKELVETSDNMSEAIISQIKERYGIRADETNKTLILIELERQAQINSLNDQIEAWKKVGEYTPANQQYAAQKRAQIDAATNKQRAEAERQLEDSLINMRDEYEKQRLDKQQDTLSKSILLIDLERDSQLRALEQERKKWIETYGEMTDAARDLFDERQKLIGQNAEVSKLQAIEDKYSTPEGRYAKAVAGYESDRETAAANGNADLIGVINQQSEETYMSLGEEYLDQNKAQFEDWLQEVSEMSLEELQTEAEELRQELNELIANGQQSTVQAQALYGKLKKVQDKSKDASTKFAKTAKDINKVYSAAGGTLEALTEDTDEATKKIAGDINSIIGSGMDMIQQIATLAQSTMAATQATAETTSEAIKSVERASVILAIIGAALAITQKIAGMIKTSNDKYEEANARQQEINEMTSSVNRYETAVLKAQQAEEKWFASSSLADVSRNWDIAAKSMDDYFTKANEMQVKYHDEKGGSIFGALLNPLGVFNGGLTNVMGVKRLTDTNLGMVKAIDNLRIETRSSKKGFLGIGGRDQKTEDLRSWVKQQYGSDLFDTDNMIDVELAQEVIDTWGDKLQGETKATLEELIELKEQYDEAMNQIKEFTAEMYSPVVDNMVDALFDWLDTGKDVMDSFHDYASDTFRNVANDMVKQLVLQQVFGDYQEKMNDLYIRYSKGELGVTGNEDSLKELARQSAALSATVINNFNEQAEGLEMFTQTLADTYKQAGIDISDINQKQQATFGGFETMSEETGTELSGRFSAMYIAQAENTQATKLLSTIVSNGFNIITDNHSILADMRTMQATANGHLETIAETARAMFLGWSDSIANIEKNTKEII